MPDKEAKVKAMLFDYGTTNRTDFRYGEVKDLIFTKYKAKSSCLRTRPLPLKDVHTLSHWKSAGIPFSLLHKPKDIVGTNPLKLQKPCEKLKDDGRLEAQKTRPRLIMTPAVSMDDIEDPEARAILIDSVYTSAMTRVLREAVAPYLSIRAPLPGLPAPSNPLKLPKLQLPYVSPEWKMDSVSWDNKQLRAHCEHTKEFWLRRELPKCVPCEQSAAVQAQRTLQHQMKVKRR